MKDKTMNNDEKIEFLIRKHERGLVVANLYQAILNCDEDAVECDVCLGLKYAIRRIEEM
jgi:hypothetical protein